VKNYWNLTYIIKSSEDEVLLEKIIEGAVSLTEEVVFKWLQEEEERLKEKVLLTSLYFKYRE